MKKMGFLILATTCFVLLTSSIQAQTDNTVQPKDWLIGIGVGPGNIYGGYSVGMGFGARASVERAIWEVGPGVIALGGELGWARKGKDYYDYKWSTNQFTIAARGSYHYNWGVEKLDTYAGIPLGVAIQSWKYDDDFFGVGPSSDTDLDIYAGIFAGASYFFSPKFGINAEIGYSVLIFQVGVVFKL